MYGKGRQGRHVTPLYSVSKAIRSQMEEEIRLKHEKKIEDFTQFYQILALFYPIIVIDVIFREERVKNSNFGGFYRRKQQKIHNEILLSV